MMKKIKVLSSLIFFLLLVGLPTLTSAAEIEVFPGSGTIGSNTTEAGWTDNHMVGQSFAVQAGVTKINRIRFTNFFLGDAGGNTGGIVSVAVFAGEPTASTQVATSPEGQTNPENSQTTVISPSGPMLAREERIFIGGELANNLASICGVDQNSIEALFLRRMTINDPQRPCPRASEWTRAYQMLSDNQQGLRNEWSDWGIPYGSGVIFGDSTFDWNPAPASYNTQQAGQYYKGDQPTKYTYPGHWTFEGGTLTVTIPNHQLTPGQYFLSIQQSHLDQNRGSEEGGYWEQGRYNCDRPNEPRQIDLYGTNTGGSQVRLDNPYCGKGNVFIAGINTQNAYGSGRAYFNTYYYSPPGYPPTSGYNAATGDLANLQIWAEASFNPVGNFEGGVCTALTGWTCDGDNYNAALRVDFYADGPAGAGTPLTSTTASLTREATVGAQCGGNPSHGFSYAIPANTLRDGRSHQIYAYGINIGSGTHTLLPGSPKPVTCTAPSSNLIGPTVTSLQIGNVDSHGFNGVVRSTGRQSAQSGKDWYNPMVVSTTVAQGSGNLKSTYVAFYSSGSSLNQLIQDVNTGIPVPQLQNILNNPANGVLMAYDARDPKNGVYYVWDPRQTGTNKWVNITGLASGVRICGPDGCNTETYFTIFPGDPLNLTNKNLNKPNTWTVQFDRNFGSKNMRTTVQAVNSYNLTTTQDYPGQL